MLAASDWPWQALFDSAPLLVILAGVVMVLLLTIVPTFMYYWYRVAKARVDADLKHAMLERGMSAEEIERVLQAKSPDK